MFSRRERQTAMGAEIGRPRHAHAEVRRAEPARLKICAATATPTIARFDREPADIAPIEAFFDVSIAPETVAGMTV